MYGGHNVICSKLDSDVSLFVTDFRSWKSDFSTQFSGGKSYKQSQCVCKHEKPYEIMVLSCDWIHDEKISVALPHSRNLPILLSHLTADCGVLLEFQDSPCEVPI